MQDEGDVRATLDRAVHLAVANVDRCDSASISVVRARRSVDTRASTSQLALDGDRLQYETGEGPCLDAIWEHRTVHSPDLGADPRWPTWGPRVVAETGATSILAFRLFTSSDTLGALNLYSRTGFDDADEDTGVALAAHVAIALSAAEETEHLTTALDTRTVIGQATGILMERLGVDAGVGFSVLARLSQETNTKLHDIAASIVSTREIPTVPRRR
jgi:GAF domain-containing protein